MSKQLDSDEKAPEVEAGTDEPIEQDDVSETVVEELEEEKPRSPIFNKNCLIIFLISVAIGGLIGGGILVSNRALEQQAQRKAEKQAPVLPSTTPITTPTPILTPEPELDLTSYQLKALNGSGGKGVAAAVRDLLETAGFIEVEVGNAGIYDYVVTEVSLKQEVPDEIFEVIVQALKDYQVIRVEEPLLADSDFDVTIIVGEKQSTD